MADRESSPHRQLFLRQQAERIFQDFLRPEAPAPPGEPGVRVAADVFEDDQSIVVEVELPGVSQAGEGSGTESEPEGARPAEFSLPELAPLLPIRDLVVFPYMIVPLLVSREISAAAVNEALATKGRLCFLTAQHDVGEEEP